MKIAIIGAGNVGGALASSSVRAGHTVTLSAKDPAHADAKAKETGARAVESAADAVRDADVVILAVPYSAVDSVLDELGGALAGKVLIDVTNRVKMEAMADSVDGTSAAEHIQKKAPKARVAKAFNYAFASKQADPKADGQSIDGYVASDDADAKKTTLELARSIGFRPIDVGPLAMSRALEAMAILNIALQIQHGWPWQSGFKLIGPTPDTKPS
ncbi:MAG TPA: NADPH-dependent F420 reductase [Candidatus Limnocylindria bacterium]